MAAIRHLGDIYDMLNDEFVFKNKDCCFRGQARNEDKVWPFVFRKYARYQATSFFIPTLQNLLQQQRLPYQFSDNLIEKMGIAQHFEVPTDLLDWSNDPLIALFFACYSKDTIDEDGEVFCLAKEAFPSYDPEFVSEADPHKDHLIFVRQIMGNPRMRAQSGCFLYWLNPILRAEEPKHSFDLEAYLTVKGKSEFLRKKTIKNEDKKIILKLLKDHYDISYESLFVTGEKIKYAEEKYKNISESAKKAHNYTEYLTGPVDEGLTIPESEANK